MKSTEFVAFHPSAAAPTAAATGGSSEEARDVHSPIVEATLRQHNRLTQPRFPHRKTPHEDCCGYCERYCENKLSTQRHHEIIAWREQVNFSMESYKLAPKGCHQQQPPPLKLKFLKRVPVNPEDPHSLTTSVVYTPPPGNSARSTRTGTPRTDNELASEFASMSLVPMGEASRSTFAGTPSAGTPLTNGKVIAGYDDGRYTPARPEEELQTDVSDRTMSNQLLNVLTIDDAMRHHRYQLISNQPKLNHSRDARDTRQHQLTSGAAELDDGLEIEQVSSAQFLDYHVDKKTVGHAPREDLRQEKYQKIIPVDSNGVPVRSVKQVLYPESAGFHSEADSGMAEGPNDYIMRAVDQAWEAPGGPGRQPKQGRYRYVKSGQEPVATKPESKRFQRLNKNLHKLMESDYLPNNKLTQKLNIIRSQSATTDGNKAKVPGKGRLMTTMSLPGSRQHTRARIVEHQRHAASTTPSRHEGKENFLEMIMDMDEKVVTVE